MGKRGLHQSKNGLGPGSVRIYVGVLGLVVLYCAMLIFEFESNDLRSIPAVGLAEYLQRCVHCICVCMYTCIHILKEVAILSCLLQF